MYNRVTTASSISIVGKTGHIHVKIKKENKERNCTTLILCTKITSKWVKDLNLRTETVKLLEENIGSKLFGISLSNIFFNIVPLIKGDKRKNEQVGFHQTKKLLQSKGNH